MEYFVNRAGGLVEAGVGKADDVEVSVVVEAEDVDGRGVGGEGTVNATSVDSSAVCDDDQMEREGGAEATAKETPKLMSSSLMSRELLSRQRVLTLILALVVTTAPEGGDGVGWHSASCPSAPLISCVL